MHKTLGKQVLINLLIFCITLKCKTCQCYTVNLHIACSIYILTRKLYAPTRRLILNQYRMGTHKQLVECSFCLNLVNKSKTLTHITNRKAIVLSKHTHIIELIIIKRNLKSVVRRIANKTIIVVGYVLMLNLDIATYTITFIISKRKTYIRHY